MDQVAGLVWTMVGVVVLMGVLLVVAVSKLIGVKRELQRLNSTLQSLEQRVAEQERRLAEVQRAMQSKGGGDIFEPFVEAFRSLKTKGWLSALTLLGSHLFRSYLGSRRRKSLPSKGGPEK